MKRMSIHLVVICLLLLSGAGCSDDIDRVELSLSFDFQLLDQLGIPFTAFQVGENFVFSFQIINTSNEALFFHYMETDEFMKVYQVDTLTSQLVLIGKPYTNIFCDQQNENPIVPNDTLKVQIPWISDSWEPGVPFYSPVICNANKNSFLPEGRYKTGFSSIFYLSKNNIKYTTPLQEFEIIFDVHFCEGKFNDKPLEHVRNCVQGKWDLLYANGGLGGVSINFIDSFIEFKMNEIDSMIWNEEGRVTSGQIGLIILENSSGNHAVKYIDGPAYGIKEIFSDTLIMYDINSEPFTYTLNRSRK